MAATKKATSAAKKPAAAPVAGKEQPKAAAKKAAAAIEVRALDYLLKPGADNEPKAAAKKAAAAIEVRALTLYFDVALNRIVAEGETFETNEERLELLSGLGLVEKV